MFVVLPIAMLFAASASGEPGAEASNFHRFLNDGLSLPVLGRTLRLGVETSGLALLLGYPLAILYVASPPRLQKPFVLLIVLPLLTSAVVRTFAWVVILGRQGLINQTLLALGLTRAPVPLLYTEPMLVVALAQIELPILALPIISALVRDRSSLARSRGRPRRGKMGDIAERDDTAQPARRHRRQCCWCSRPLAARW